MGDGRAYYTSQRQAEMLTDRYPVELIAGGQPVAMSAQTGVA